MTKTVTIQYAGFWRRLVATVVDAIVFAAAASAALYLLYGSDYFAWSKENEATFATYGWGDALINNAAPVMLTVFFWVKFLGTPGKLLLGCQVVDARTLQPLRVGQALLRYIAYLVSLIPLGLGFFWVAWDKRKQAFHDKIAKTVVIMEDESHKTLEELEKGWS